MKKIKLLKTLPKGRQEGTGVIAQLIKHLPCKHEAPEPKLKTNSGVVVYTCSPSTKEKETGGSLGLIGQVVYPTW